MCLSDDIDNIITSAKNMVKSAKDVTTNVLDELLPIQEDVEKMKGTYGSTQSAGFSKALTEANNSGWCCFLLWVLAICLVTANHLKVGYLI